MNTITIKPNQVINMPVHYIHGQVKISMTQPGGNSCLPCLNSVWSNIKHKVVNWSLILILSGTI